MRHHNHASSNHLTQEGWLKLLVGKETLEQLKQEYGTGLQVHLNEMYRAYIARTNETLMATKHIGDVRNGN